MCPFCTNQALHILQTASGPVEQCPMCSGLMIPWEMLKTFSSDVEFRASLEKVPIMPTGRICPHCLGRLGQGRFPGRETIVTLCATCKLMWTDLYDLEQLDRGIAQALQEQMENPSVVPMQRTGITRPGEAIPFPGLLGEEPAMENTLPGGAAMAFRQAEIEQQYKALEKTLREEWDKREEQLGLLHGEVLKKAQGEHQQRLEALQNSIEALEKKRQDQEAHLQDLKTRLDANERRKDAVQQNEAQATKAEYARHLEKLLAHIDGLEKKRQTQDGDIAELKKRLEVMESRRSEPKSEPHPPSRSVTVPPLPMGEGTDIKLKPVETPKPEPVKEAAKPREPAPVEPVAPRPVEAPKPPPVQPVKVPSPVVQKPSTPKKSLVSELLGPLKTLWTPTPKPTFVPAPKPAVPAPAPAPAPVAAVQPVVSPTPAPVKPAVTAKPGFLSVLKNAWSPKPAPSKPKPVQATPIPRVEPVRPEPVPTPKAEPIKSAPKPEPVIEKAKPAGVPKQKPAGGLFDRMIGWAPRIVPVAIYLLAGLIEDDWGRAFVWALMFGSIALAIRTWRMYSGGRFEEITAADLTALPGATAWKGKAVLLRGTIDPASEKPLVFQDATGSVPLNRLRRLEILPYICGLVSRGQFPAGEFQLKGWYRRTAAPFIEVAEARGEKMLRKSMVKGVRWGLAIAGFLFSILLLFVLE